MSSKDHPGHAAHVTVTEINYAGLCGWRPVREISGTQMIQLRNKIGTTPVYWPWLSMEDFLKAQSKFGKKRKRKKIKRRERKAIENADKWYAKKDFEIERDI